VSQDASTAGATPRTPRLTHEQQLKLGGDIQRRIGIKTVRDESLARFTTMRVGGPADLFAEVRNLFELRGIVRFARTRDIPLFLIGRGGRLIAEAGLPMAKAATVTKAAGLSGLEFGMAIPGTIGGAVWANAGAHGSDVRAVLVEALVAGADGGETVLGPDELGRLRYDRGSAR